MGLWTGVDGVTVVEAQVAVAVPEQGNLVRVRDRYWVVESVRQSSRPLDPMSPNGLTQHHLVSLVPIDDKGSAEPLSVFWETEPGTEVRPQAELPDPTAGVDDAETFAAFLDAARWGAIASADPSSFQSPFRAGIDIEDYQLLPLVEALRMPRVGLLIADDVGLGKTVEAGLIAQELVLRNQAQKILVVCPPSLCQKWQREMRDQFGLRFEVVDTDWETTYPPMIGSWRKSWGEFVPFGEFPAELRRVACTANATDSHCARFRRAVRHRGHFPNEQAAMKAHLPCRHRQTQEPTQPHRQGQRLEDHPEHPGRPLRRPHRRPHPMNTTTAGYTKNLTVPPLGTVANGRITRDRWGSRLGSPCPQRRRLASKDPLRPRDSQS